MKYFVDVDDQQFEVEVRESRGQLHVLIDGQPVNCDYAQVDRAGQVALKVEDRSFGVSLSGTQNDYDVNIAGHRFSVVIEDERERAAHAAERAKNKGGGTVKAVMPGVIVDLVVAVGDIVETGQALLILEAMKMQNEIGAPGPGRVKRILIEAGQAVAGGAPLVELEALQEDAAE